MCVCALNVAMSSLPVQSAILRPKHILWNNRSSSCFPLQSLVKIARDFQINTMPYVCECFSVMQFFQKLDTGRSNAIHLTLNKYSIYKQIKDQELSCFPSFNVLR